MARSARLFLCARCRDQVLLCSHCDRGQRYCSRACASGSRRERRREAARSYQLSDIGQRKHAARTARWRERRRRSLRQEARAPATAGGEVDDKEVTHQGCNAAGVRAPLPVCDTPSDIPGDTPDVCPDIGTNSRGANSSFSAGTAALATRCRRCCRLLLPHVRSGYLRRSSVRELHAHDHPS